MENCPICNTKVKSGLFSSNSWTEQYKLDVFNEFNEEKHERICSNCSDAKFSTYFRLLNTQIFDLKSKIIEIQNRVLVSTYEPNVNWDYNFIDFVSSSITIGTSVTTEITSAFTDLVGNESSKYKTIIENAEKICLTRIKENAFNNGGNAIVGFKMNISEVGGSKGMILISMYGTLIKIVNGKNLNLYFNNITEISDRYKHLKKLKENLPQI